MKWSKKYRSIYVELHRVNREYIVLISYGGIDRNSEDLVDRVEVVNTDRKYLLIVKKETWRYFIPDKDEYVKHYVKGFDNIEIVRPEPGIIKIRKPESDMIIYLLIIH